MEKLERMLAQWIGHQHQHGISLSTIIIQAEVKSLFENLNAIGPDLKLQSSSASGGLNILNGTMDSTTLS
jgi:hypothetical protein